MCLTLDIKIDLKCTTVLLSANCFERQRLSRKESNSVKTRILGPCCRASIKIVSLNDSNFECFPKDVIMFTQNNCKAEVNPLFHR